MEANARNLERIFDQTIVYQIPLFQRPYVWNEDENWQPLWDDIQMLMDKYLDAERAHTHFLGAVVFEQLSNATGSIEARQVIDGQQRLTTLQIFLIAVRDLCAELESEKYLERFTDLTENKSSRIDSEIEKYKVWPTNSDRGAFVRTHEARGRKQVIAEFTNDAFVSRVGMNIPDAYLFFFEKLHDWFSGESSDNELVEKSKDEKLEALWQVVRDHLKLVVIDLEKEDESQVIFETLNARGTQLLPGDLIKNYLFHKAQVTEKELESLYQTCWHDFDDPDGPFWRQEVKQGRLNRPRIDLFMQHYLTLHTQDDVRVAHIFNTFKYYSENYKLKEDDQRNLPSTPAEHLEALHEYGKVFRTFFEPEPNSRLALFIKRLDAVDTATVFPFLLEATYALSAEQNEEFENILQLLESFLIRRMICGLTAKNYNRYFIELIKFCQKDGVITEKKVAEFLTKSNADTSRFPNDEEFQNAWLTRPIYKNLAQYKVRAVLAALDSALEHSKSETLTLPEGLTIEHVMPVKWEKNWPLLLDDAEDSVGEQELVETRNRLLNSFGNLTLITRSLNPSLSNSSWDNKKPELVKFSKLNLNRYFHDCATWDEASITVRGQELFGLAKLTWPIPSTINDV